MYRNTSSSIPPTQTAWSPYLFSAVVAVHLSLVCQAAVVGCCGISQISMVNGVPRLTGPFAGKSRSHCKALSAAINF
jgi:hypothetical protein